MSLDIKSLTGEATAYDKKQMLEVKRPKSWLKSVSAFANGEGGTLIFGISDDDQIIGLSDVQGDAEKISEEVKSKLDPVPAINLEIEEIEGKQLILLHIYPGQESPYYYIGDKQRLAFVRIGNESVVADRIQLKSLVLKGSGHTYDSLPSCYKFEDMAFSKLRSVHYKRLQRSFDDNEFVSWGIVDENGKLTNADALLADESPVRQSRIFCTRWNGLDMTNGLGEAIDDVELEGCIIGQLQDAVSFVRNNSHKKWWKGNLNFESNNVSDKKEFIKRNPKFTKEFIKEDFVFTKEFIKASRQIYKLISSNSHITAAQMADNMNLSSRQVLKYLKQLQELQKISRIGGRKMGEWKIIDKEYEGFFDRI